MIPEALNPYQDQNKGTVLTRLGDMAIQFLALKLAYRIATLPDGEVTPDNPAIQELRELIQGLELPESD